MNSAQRMTKHIIQESERLRASQKSVACGAALRFTVAGLTVMANGYVGTGAPPDLSAGGGRLAERSGGCGVGAAGAADPAGIARRASAQD